MPCPVPLSNKRTGSGAAGTGFARHESSRFALAAGSHHGGSTVASGNRGALSALSSWGGGVSNAGEAYDWATPASGGSQKQLLLRDVSHDLVV